MTDAKTELRKAPRQARSRALVDAIVEATSRLMASEGLPAVTTSRVAEVAGVSIGSLYQYFPGREALIAAVIDGKLESDLRELTPIVEALQRAPLDDAIAGLVDMVVRYYRDETALYREMIAALDEADRAARVRSMVEGFDRVVVMVLEPHRDQIPATIDDCAWIMRVALIACVREAAAERPEVLRDGALSRRLEAACRGLLGLSPR